jgi:hypothetical protein
LPYAEADAATARTSATAASQIQQLEAEPIKEDGRLV